MIQYKQATTCFKDMSTGVNTIRSAVEEINRKITSKQCGIPECIPLEMHALKENIDITSANKRLQFDVPNEKEKSSPTTGSSRPAVAAQRPSRSFKKPAKFSEYLS